jgi:hypothetical protein
MSDESQRRYTHAFLIHSPIAMMTLPLCGDVAFGFASKASAQGRRCHTIPLACKKTETNANFTY